MRIGIKYKFFFTLFLTSSIVVASMYFFMQWSFNRGFVNYANSQELNGMGYLADGLLKAYAVEGNWDFLRDNRRRWRQIQFRSIRAGRRLADALPPDAGPPGADPLRIGPRTLLLDAAKHLVVGGERRNISLKEVKLRPLKYQGKVVGYLAVVANRLADEGDRLYVERQTRIFGLIALTMILVSMLLGIPLINHLLVPIKAMTKGAGQLTSGDYKVRIPVTTGDELGQLSRDFNLLAATLEKNEQTRRQNMSDISHELRTPLAVLQGEIEAVQDGVRAAEPTLAVLHNEVLRLNRLVDDLYELSLSDLGALSYRKQRVDPALVLEQVVELYAPRLAERRIELVARLPEEGSLALNADAHRLQQLFTNLLENSLRYTDPGGRVEVEMHRQDKELRITIQDSAPAVGDEQRARLFERFYRVDGSRNRAKGGTGLGLAICKNIVEAHQGRIEANPSPLGGLAIAVALPIS